MMRRRIINGARTELMTVAPRAGLTLGLSLAATLTLATACGSSEADSAELITGTDSLLPEEQLAAMPSSMDTATMPSAGNTSAAPGEQPVVDDAELIESTEEVETNFGEECARDSYVAERVDVNLYLLLDISGSMDAPIAADSTVTQWDAVRSALVGFIESEDTAGFNLALNYYPVLSERSDCGPDGACDSDIGCVAALCDLRFLLFDIIQPCTGNNQCQLAFDDGEGNIYLETCMMPGRCSNAPMEMCYLDDQCGEGGLCDVEAGLAGLCPGQNSCTTGDYSTPAVERSSLPEGAANMVESLLDHAPDPFAITPTQIALQGAYERVTSWIGQDPTTPSFVVLATDGAPVGCTETAQDDPLAQTLSTIEGAHGEGIETFVIGVVPDLSGLPEEDQAELAPTFEALADALDDMAELGGTAAPFNVTFDDTTTESFRQALDAIRGQVVSCEFEIPEPETGTVSFERLNVELSREGQSEVVPKVDGAGDCVDGENAWHYDVDEATQSPTSVVLCPSTCDQVNAQAGTGIDIVLGCQTVNRVR